MAIHSLSSPAYDLTVSYADAHARAVQGGGAAGWFGPLAPLPPVAPKEVAGRRFDYPFGFNLHTRPRSHEQIGFPELRALADNYDLLRLVIETRKDQLERVPWSIRPKASEFGPGQGEPPEALKKLAKDITLFLRRPDHRLGWKPWLRSLLEDLFVIDAPCLYRRPTRGGGIYAYEVIDGATIKPVIDDGGRITGYQQVLKGLPAVDYTFDELIYRPRNVRSNRVYGFSPVEQIVMTVNIALRRQIWQLQYYTEGNVPDALIGAPEQWTPAQIADFQGYWDALFEGNTAQRRHAKFVPGGVAKTYIPTKEPELKNVFDEWLARVTCFCFSISAQPFVSQINRGEADVAYQSAEEDGVTPTQDWVKDLIDERIETDFGETQLEFAWADKDPDPDKQAERLTRLVAGCVLRPNEARQAIGKEPDKDPAADMLGTIGPGGFVPIAISAAPKPPPPEGGLFGKPTAGGDGDEDVDPGAKKPGADATGEEDDDGDGEVGKLATAPFARPPLAKGWRRLKPVLATRKFGRAVATSLREIIAKVFKDAAPDIAKQVRLALAKADKAAKAEESDAERLRRIYGIADSIAKDVDLDGLNVMVDATATQLERLTKDTASRVMAQLGVIDREDLVDQVNDSAVAMARDRAAEMVGKRWVDGELVDNPDAVYRIDQTTRDEIRDVIADGLEENVGFDEIAQRIEDATGFSEERAALIAEFEIARANSDAALDSYGAAREAGVETRKEWLLGENPCDICQENADAGPIELDEDFPSGDDAPPGHLHCECAIAAVVEDDGE